MSRAMVPSGTASTSDHLPLVASSARRRPRRRGAPLDAACREPWRASCAPAASLSSSMRLFCHVLDPWRRGTCWPWRRRCRARRPRRAAPRPRRSCRRPWRRRAPPRRASRGSRAAFDSADSSLLHQEARAPLAHQPRQRVRPTRGRGAPRRRRRSRRRRRARRAPREGLVVLLFFLVEAQVLEQAELPGRADLGSTFFGRRRCSRRAGAPRRRVSSARRAPQGSSERPSRLPGFGRPEVDWRGSPWRRPRIANLDRGQRLADARVVGDGARLLVEGDVEVHADEDALPERAAFSPSFCRAPRWCGCR
jgi:hypothetical protein